MSESKTEFPYSDLLVRLGNHSREQHEACGGDKASDCLICEAADAIRQTLQPKDVAQSNSGLTNSGGSEGAATAATEFRVTKADVSKAAFDTWARYERPQERDLCDFLKALGIEVVRG